jgi:hypothetical protein
MANFSGKDLILGLETVFQSQTPIDYTLGIGNNKPL